MHAGAYSMKDKNVMKTLKIPYLRKSQQKSQHEMNEDVFWDRCIMYMRYFVGATINFKFFIFFF